MHQHLHREIQKLKKSIMIIGTLVEESLRDSIKAIVERDKKRAQTIIKEGSVVDEMEVELEEECLKILALHQPVAIDLRYIISVLKINNDLERIGDLAENIAERAEFLSSQLPIKIPDTIPLMASIVQNMLKNSLNALVNMDTLLATKVCESDDQVDDLHSGMYPLIQSMIEKEPKKIDALLQLLSISRYLERAADHCTNIAEDVEYLVEGHIKRHH
ncbi:MAG: phosphate signaling complex protein PhoU [Candidatus Marinimicrobia bacterium]|nr:phosphate signaling complex protein PhoU [Candidatus Neomarinimicrobiota bacterium]